MRAASVDGHGRRSRGDAPVRGVGSWMQFLAGFALLWGVLQGVAALDPTARWGWATDDVEDDLAVRVRAAVRRWHGSPERVS